MILSKTHYLEDQRVDIGVAIQRDVELSNLRVEAWKTLNGPGLKLLDKVKKHFSQRRLKEQRQYEINFDSRIQETTDSLSALNADIKKMPAYNWLNPDEPKSAIYAREAIRIVPFEHFSLMSQIATAEEQSILRLLDQHENHVRSHFNIDLLKENTMNHYYSPDEKDRLAQARESYSGRLLTDTQFDEAIAITGVIEREIHKSGKFKEKLSDYSYAMARSEKFDAMKSETIIRDLFKQRTGQSMNGLREEIMARESELDEGAQQRAYAYVKDIGPMMKDGNKISFHRASSHMAKQCADEFQISEVGAKGLLADAFKTEEDKEFYVWGQQLEEKYYRPQVDAEKLERQAHQQKPRSFNRRR